MINHGRMRHVRWCGVLATSTASKARERRAQRRKDKVMDKVQGL